MHKQKGNLEKSLANYNMVQFAVEKFQNLRKHKDETGEDSERMIREVVSDEEIGDIVSQWTGIPISKLVETERKSY